MDAESLNELLECSVCLEMLDHTSKVLPCQHTFCRRCLDEIISTKHELRCPECRTLVDIKVHDLPTNILLVRLLEGLKTKQTVERSRSPGAERRDAYSGAGGHAGRQTSLLQPSARALYNYEGNDPGDLSFRKGDVVILRKQIDDNWYHGELNGQQGFFPASYVQVLIPLPVTIPQCKALFDFDVNKGEKDCLSFKKDDIITVIKRVDNNWVEGKKHDKIGIFPVSFVQMNEAAKQLLNAKSRPPMHAASFNIKTDKSRAAPVLNIAAPPTEHKKRHSYTGSSHVNSQLKPVNISQQHRRSLEISGSGSLLMETQTRSMSPPPFPTSTYIATKGSVNGGSRPSGQEASASQDMKVEDEGQPSAASMVLPGEPVSSKSGEARGLSTPIFISLYPYKPKKEDELELRKGDYFTVSDKCLDGWFRGTCLKTGKGGVFPGNYVQSVRPQSAFRAVGNANVLNIRAKVPTSASVSTGPTSSTVMSSSVKTSNPEIHPRKEQPPSSQRRSRSPTRHSVTPPRATSSPTNAASSHQSSAKVSSVPSSNMHNMDLSVQSLAAGASAHSISHHKSQKQHHLRRSSSASATSHSHKRHHQTSSKNRNTANNNFVPPNTTSIQQYSNPPNMVVGGATGDVPSCVLMPSKDKKKDKEKISLVKRLTSGKIKKSKSPGNDEVVGAASATPHGDNNCNHVRSGSCPSDTSGVLQLEGGHVKTGSFDSSVHISQQKPKRPNPPLREKFQCVAPYPRQSDFELDLQVGDIVYVHKKRDDGWFKGTLQRTGKSGLFPGSFVEKIVS